MIGRFSDNSSFREYERLTVRLHQLMAAGHGESDEADAVRDQMDGPWRHLSRDEVERVNGLSADLYMLSGEEIHEKADPTEREPQTLGLSLLEAKERGDWDTVLRLLRKGPSFWHEAQIALIGAEAYYQLKKPEVALLFLDHAAAKDPGNPQYAVLALDLLRRLGKDYEAMRRAERLTGDPGTSAPVQILSADVLLRTARFEAWPDRPDFDRLVKVLANALDRISHDDRGAASVTTSVLGYLDLAFCLELLGRLDEAQKVYAKASELYPDNPYVLLAKAMSSGSRTPPDTAERLTSSGARPKETYDRRRNWLRLTAGVRGAGFASEKVTSN